MRDVAALAGVSLKTVSRVVNGERKIAPETGERVNRAIQELNFTRNDLARSLKSKRGSRLIGLVIEDLANPFYSGIARGVEEEATRRGYMVVMGSSEEDAARERTLVSALANLRVEGIVVVPAGRDHSYLRPEMEAGLRVVFLDRPPGKIEADTILLDNFGAARRATAELVGEGHTRIGILADRQGTLHSVAERVRGYRAALKRAGIGPDAALERFRLRTAEQAQVAAGDLIDKEHPSAIFATNNRAAIGAVRAVVRARADIAIIGFDDFELADLVPRRIRVITHDPHDLGRRAAQALFDRIEDNQPAPTRTIVQPELAWRGMAEAELAP